MLIFNIFDIKNNINYCTCVQIYHDYMQMRVKTNHEFFPNGFLIHKKRTIFPSFSFFKLEEVSYAYSQSKEFIIRSSQ